MSNGLSKKRGSISRGFFRKKKKQNKGVLQLG